MSTPKSPFYKTEHIVPISQALCGPRANLFEAVQPLWKTGLAVTGEAAH